MGAKNKFDKIEQIEEQIQMCKKKIDDLQKKDLQFNLNLFTKHLGTLYQEQIQKLESEKKQLKMQLLNEIEQTQRQITFP